MERIKVADAAKALGVSQQFVRIGLQQGRLPIGKAVKMSSVWTYYISKTALDAFMNDGGGVKGGEAVGKAE